MGYQAENILIMFYFTETDGKVYEVFKNTFKSHFM